MDAIKFIEHYIDLCFLLGFWSIPVLLYYLAYRTMRWYYYLIRRKCLIKRSWLQITHHLHFRECGDRWFEMPKTYRLTHHFQHKPYP